MEHANSDLLLFKGLTFESESYKFGISLFLLLGLIPYLITDGEWRLDYEFA